jgi:hypothetical protein
VQVDGVAQRVIGLHHRAISRVVECTTRESVVASRSTVTCPTSSAFCR